MLKAIEVKRVELYQRVKEYNNVNKVMQSLQNINQRYTFLKEIKSKSNVKQLNDYILIEEQKIKEKDALERRLDELVRESREIESIIGNKVLTQLQINMNLNKLEIEEKLNCIEQRCKAAEDQKQSLLDSLHNKKPIQDTISFLCSKYYQALGQIKHLKSIVGENERELQLPQHINIHKDMQYLSFQLLAIDKVITAMEKRHDAIEEGIMSYHNKKMLQINKAIKDLWKLTYKSKDIETIEIKSDLEKASARSHSFNYRIVFKTIE